MWYNIQHSGTVPGTHNIRPTPLTVFVYLIIQSLQKVKRNIAFLVRKYRVKTLSLNRDISLLLLLSQPLIIMLVHGNIIHHIGLDSSYS